MQLSYWPWWLGALALAGVGVGSYWLLRRPLGVSRYLGKVCRGPQSEDQLLNDPIALQAALLEATREEFGEAEARSLEASMPVSESFIGSLVFLVMLVVGGLIASLLRGDWGLRADIGESFSASFGAGPLSWIVLLLGGAMVGFGARLAGGCTSGHGLSGCSRLSVSSFIVVACFFIGGTAVSLGLRSL